MPVRPSQSGSSGTWGTELNAWLDVAHNSDGTIIQGQRGNPQALTGAVAATRYVGGTTSGAPASGAFAVGDFVVDQTGVVWVCVTAGSPGTWTSTTSPAQLLLTGQGLVSESFSRSGAASTTLMTGGTAYAMTVALKAGSVVTNVLVVVQTGASGITLYKAGIYSATGASQLAVTPDRSAVISTTTGMKTLALSAPWTVPADATYQVVMVATASTTLPTIARASLAAAGVGAQIGTSPFLYSTAGTGLTDLPAAPLTLSATGATYAWVGLS